jgi:RNA polymerase sigma factor FliA
MKQDKVMQYIPLVHREVRNLIRKGILHHEYDEFVQIGIIGLIEAVTRFDEQKGRSFSKYAQIRIQGSILDELRKRDWVPRSVRQRSKQLNNGIAYLQEKLHRKPTQSELCLYLQVEEHDFEHFCFYANISSLVSMDAGEHPIRERLLSDSMNPQEELINREAMEKVQLIISTLAPKERDIIHQYYFEGQKMKVIAKKFRVSESRICQLHRKITKKLAQRMKQLP